MALTEGGRNEKAGWLKRLRARDGSACKPLLGDVILAAASKAVIKGHVHVEGACTITRDSSERRGCIQDVGFVRDIAWSIGRHQINTYGRSDASRYYTTSSTIKPSENQFRFTHACASGSDRLYCLTDGAQIYTANLEVGKIEGRIPLIGSKYEYEALLKIISAPATSPDWSLISVLDDRGRLYILDNRTNGVVRRLNAATNIQAMAFKSDSVHGGSMLAGSSTGDLFEWDLRSEECTMRHKIEGSLGIIGIDIRPTENSIFLADAFGPISQHKLNKSTADEKDFPLIKQYSNLGKPANVFVGHSASPLIVAANQDVESCVKMINTVDKCVYQNWPGPNFTFGKITASAFHQSSSMVALGNDRGVVKVWQFDSY